jgi:hypothetical protein
MYKIVALVIFIIFLILVAIAQTLIGQGEEAGLTGAILEVIGLFAFIFSLGTLFGGFIAKKWN